jgi:hypothetical protein
MGIGAYLPDAMQRHSIVIYNYNPNGPDVGLATVLISGINGYSGNLLGYIMPDGAGAIRLAYETRVASVSAYLCIKY